MLNIKKKLQIITFGSEIEATKHVTIYPFTKFDTCKCMTNLHYQ